MSYVNLDTHICSCDMQAKASEASQATQEKAGEMKEQGKGMAQSAQEKGMEATQAAQEKATQAKEQTGSLMEQVMNDQC